MFSDTKFVQLNGSEEIFSRIKSTNKKQRIKFSALKRIFWGFIAVKGLRLKA